MCVAFLQRPNSEEIPEDWFLNGGKRNSHGCGYMFVANNKLVIRKGFWNWQLAHDNYVVDHYQYPESYFGVHFRLATQGSVNDDNCHPHVIKPEKWALMHTGMLPLDDVYPSDKSDSALLAEMMSSMSPKQLQNIEDNRQIRSIVGRYSTVTLMGVNSCVILNEDRGHWNGDVWCSNSSYREDWGSFPW